MSLIQTLMLVVHLLAAVALCGFVLLQHGKGADMGAAFGSGASGSVFGAAGSANFLSRTTGILAAVFFLTSLGLTWYNASQLAPKSVLEQGVMDKAPKGADVPVPPGGSAPAGSAPAPAPAPVGSVPAKPAPPAGGAADSKSGEVPK
jgi:preprotein translocase subunit SecG